MYEQANRPFPDFPVDIPLPLYVCSVGKRGGESGSGHVPPLLSQFIGMTFCVRGSGVAYLFDRPFRMRENDVISRIFEPFQVGFREPSQRIIPVSRPSRRVDGAQFLNSVPVEVHRQCRGESENRAGVHFRFSGSAIGLGEDHAASQVIQSA